MFVCLIINCFSHFHYFFFLPKIKSCFHLANRNCLVLMRLKYWIVFFQRFVRNSFCCGCVCLNSVKVSWNIFIWWIFLLVFGGKLCLIKTMNLSSLRTTSLKLIFITIFLCHIERKRERNSTRWKWKLIEHYLRHISRSPRPDWMHFYKFTFR